MQAFLIKIGIIVVICLIVGLIIYFQKRQISSLKEEVDDLNEVVVCKQQEIDRRRLSMNKIAEHTTRVKFTEKELAPIKKQVKEAINEKDVMAAIGNLVNINNRRM